MYLSLQKPKDSHNGPLICVFILIGETQGNHSVSVVYFHRIYQNEFQTEIKRSL